jgi:MoaA/NifB/PqqE/SkfB family radical SAM enzyme
MDIRIVNTCNNNCLYCLEQSLRKKNRYIDKQEILWLLNDNINEKIISFYWWNPLLHPDFEEILEYCKTKWFTSIGILTNTYGLNKKNIQIYKWYWLTTVNFYFHSFNKSKHDTIVNGWISLSQLLSNIYDISTSGLNHKVIIHINHQNIKDVFKTVYILYSKYWIHNFEFVNYFPFDRPYDKYKNLLEYDYEWNRNNIEKIFRIIIKYNLDVKFLKFSKDFFWKYTMYYDYKNWVINQIWEEDIERLNILPFCYHENRCSHCFIKDNCKYFNS